MFKYHKFMSLAFGLLYLVMLESFTNAQTVFRFLIPAFLLYCGLATYYNKAYLKHVQKYNFWLVLRPLLLFVSGFGIFFLLPNSAFRGLYLTTAAVIISVIELALGNFAENLLINETLIIAFGFFITLAAFNQYFVNTGDLKLFGRSLPGVSHYGLQPLYLAFTFLLVLLLSRSFYEFIPQGAKTKWVAAASLGLFCSELFWALSFLPFHYSAQAAILFCIFYFCLVLNYHHLFHTLTLKKIQFHLLLMVMACGIVVFATPWKILN